MARHQKLVGPYYDLVELQLRESLSSLTGNKVTLLINGEKKFPSLLEDLQQAKSFIHLEYYIVEDDTIGNQIKDILIRKAKEGVTVRFIYDDFGSREIRSRIAPELQANGVHIHPFYRIHFLFFANRINYRDHRKVIIIDGLVGYIGGINLSDRYVNSPDKGTYWRDTHLRVEGAAVLSLQYHFLSNWNFCADDNLGFSPTLFPLMEEESDGDDLVQIVTGGPDYPRPSIMMSYFTAIMAARRSIYITTPYFIPNESIFNAIKTAALSGKDVRLLLPTESDSSFVDAASRFYVQELLESGVRVYFYQKGFVHSKTMVVDHTLSIAGTSNMDLRSFELNFEINAVVYSERINAELTGAFFHDLENSRLVTLEEWNTRSNLRRFLDGVARIIAPLL
jgi:cardiolipin synthase